MSSRCPTRTGEEDSTKRIRLKAATARSRLPPEQGRFARPLEHVVLN